MGSKNDYQNGRLDGLLLGLKIAQAGGVEQLEKECKVRGAWNFHTNLEMRELDKASESIKEITYQTLLIASLAVLHDAFGFGQVRCQRFMEHFNKLAQYLDHGWLYWYDLIEEIRERLNLQIEAEALTEKTMGKGYAHPEPEDVYSEADLIEPSAWNQLLHELGFKEDPVGVILDEDGKRFISYEGQYNRIQVYDVLYGMTLAKDHWEVGA